METTKSVGMKQPAAGILATIVVMAIALGFISLFDFPTFVGWIAYCLLCLIPVQIVIAVTWGSNPAFAAKRKQPAKGGLLIALTLLVGAIVAPVYFIAVGGRVSPPTPMLAMCTIVSVIITFWATIMWGGWPFTTLIKNPVAAGLVMLAVCYAVNYLLFRVFFDYGFLQGAPVYVPAQDPHGLFSAWYALSFYLTALAVMFLFVNFDLWPFTKFPSVMRQPVLGMVWTTVVLVLAAAAYYIVVALGTDPVSFMVHVPVPFIFGTIVVQNMLQGSLFAKWTQPMKGVLNVIAVVAIGSGLAALYRALASVVTGALKAGPPGYDLEVWLASALLSVTFPFLIFHAEFFKLWPLKKELAEKA
jgi:hypothetical protein